MFPFISVFTEIKCIIYQRLLMRTNMSRREYKNKYLQILVAI